MPPVEFETTVSAGERPQTYALGRAATGTGLRVYIGIYKSDVSDNQRYRTNSPCWFVHKRVCITDKKKPCCVSNLVERIAALLHFEGGYCAVNVWRGLYVIAKTARGCPASAYKYKTIVGGYSPLSAAKLNLDRGAAMENTEKNLAHCTCFTRKGEVFA
jgi:hypothetical protein